MKQLLHKPKFQRVLALVLTGIFMLSAALSGTMAWADFTQHRTNVAEGDGSAKRCDAILQKCETGTETPVAGAAFSLYRVNADGTATWLATYTTGVPGQIQAMDLQPGEYYWQEIAAPTGYLPEIEDGQAKKYPFTLPGEGDQPVRVTAYNTRRNGKLALTKTVMNSDNSALTQAQKDMLFEFTITFGDGKSYSYSIDGGAAQTVASGGKIYLKSGQVAQFESIPTGVYYSIIETPVQNYVTTSENHAGNIPAEGVTASFTNTFNVPQENKGGLIVSKTVTGNGANLEQSFKFTATIGGVEHIFSLKHGETKSYLDLPLGTEYVVTEIDVPNGYTPMVEQYSGKISAAGVTVELPFTNHFEGDNPPDLPGNLEISKTVVGDDSGQEFTFEITFEGEPKQIFSLKNGESKSFLNIPRGVKYTVREVDSGSYVPDFAVASGVIAWNETVKVDFKNRVSTEPPDELWLTVTKRVLGNPPAEHMDKTFHFMLTINGEKHEFDLKKDETSQRFAVQPGDAYSLTEQNYLADGYAQTGVINGSGVVGRRNIEIVQTNTYNGPETVDIEGEKTWSKPDGINLPESVTIRIMNGSVVVRSVVTNAEKNWRYAFVNLPKHDALGNEISYTVEEVRIPSWHPIVTGNDIKNTYLEPLIDEPIEVEKAITGTPANAVEFRFKITAVSGAPMPKQSEISITGAGKASFGAITYSDPGTYIYTISEVDSGVKNWTYDASLYTLTVTITEENGKLKVSKALTKNGFAAEKPLFTNRYDESGETISVKVTKIWQGDTAADRPASIQAQLLKDGTPYGDPATLSSANNWTRTWSGLDKNAVWSVKEVAVPEGYSAAVSGDAINGFTITNTKQSGETETTSVKVTKIWQGEDAKRPGNIVVQLFKNGSATGVPVTLSAANSWTYTWSNLEKGPTWTVDEINVPSGYLKAITGDAANGFVITNTKTTTPEPDEETIIISGKKTWNHGENAEKNRPESIIIFVKANGEILLQKQISAAENWKWSFKLMKYDSAGKEIVYTVDEAEVTGYIKTIDGHSLINTYKPADPSDPTDPSKPTKPTTPITDDESKLALWLTLMLLSLGALAAVIFIPRRRRRAKNR